MPVLRDYLEAVEVSPHLRNVIDHRGDSEDGGVTSVILKHKHVLFLNIVK